LGALNFEFKLKSNASKHFNEELKMVEEKILRIPQVIEMTGLKKTTIYLLVKAGKFPKPFRIGKRAVGWKYSSIRDWLERL
jgi:prophage regulatory protein